MMFIGLGLSGVVPVFHGISIYGYEGMEDRMSVSFVILQGALYIFGAVLYAVCSHTCSMWTRLILYRLAGLSDPLRVASTFGAAPTRYSTSLSC